MWPGKRKESSILTNFHINITNFFLSISSRMATKSPMFWIETQNKVKFRTKSWKVVKNFRRRVAVIYVISAKKKNINLRSWEWEEGGTTRPIQSLFTSFKLRNMSHAWPWVQIKSTRSWWPKKTRCGEERGPVQAAKERNFDFELKRRRERGKWRSDEGRGVLK